MINNYGNYSFLLKRLCGTHRWIMRHADVSTSSLSDFFTLGADKDQIQAKVVALG